jgi:amino acid transporter
MSNLEDAPINVKLKLSALWAATTFCYIYGDYFELYVPGKLSSMLDGRMGPLGPVTQNILLSVSITLAIPSLMVCLSLILKPAISRWLNIVFGLFFTIIMFLAIRGTWNFYMFFGVIEILLTLVIAWLAWKWPTVKNG